MLIGLCGGSSAGKTTIATYLQNIHNFRLLSFESSNDPPSYFDSGRDLSKTWFSSVDKLLEFVTERWEQNWVVSDLYNYQDIEVLSRRPFFLLIFVDAPLGLRYARLLANSKTATGNNCLPKPGQFVTIHDQQFFKPNGLSRVATALATNTSINRLCIVNIFASIPTLTQALTALKLTDESRLRPNWDQYFMELASLAAKRSNCMKRLVGCVLVREKRVISTGYNGTPRGMTNCNQGGCHRCNAPGQTTGGGLDTCLCLHAEENALLEAGRERIREGATLYCNTCPCLTCSVKIAQVGISEVVYNTEYSVDSKAAAIFQEAGISLRKFIPSSNYLSDENESPEALTMMQRLIP